MLQLKPWSVRRASDHPSSFYGQLADYYSHAFTLFHLVDEFFFKEMKRWGQSNTSSCCIYGWRKSREIGVRGSPRSPTPIMENFSADLLPATKGYWTELP